MMMMMMMITMITMISFGFKKWQKFSCLVGRLLIVQEVELMKAYYGVAGD
jgi:hypothetical protein